MVEILLQTPLLEQHQKLKAKLVPFAGYTLPVQYKSIIAESKAVRESAGMFDVSHMGRFKISGNQALPFLEYVTTNNVSLLEDGKGHYSLLPNFDGTCIDDIILYRTQSTDYCMIVNASNHQKDFNWLKSHNKWDTVINDVTNQTAMIAVQGPKAVEKVCSLSTELDSQKLIALPHFGILNTQLNKIECFIARSGYTGEDGFEIICYANDASKLWEALLNIEVEPCGLGSRDVLRVEAGLPLYGHELNENLPLSQAGLNWVIDKNKDFIGCSKIREKSNQFSPYKLVGIQLQSRRIPHPGMTVMIEDQSIGIISSGVYSPLLDCGIGFAYIDSKIQLNSDCFIHIRGTNEKAKIVQKRFFKRPK